MAERFRVIGRPVPRIDGVAKVTGAAAYVGDLHLPGLQHAAVARSAVPHARIVSCSLDAARAVPGVALSTTTTWRTPFASREATQSSRAAPAW